MDQSIKRYNISVKDISKIVTRLQHQIDSQYQDAVLSNYSHEQLTPLNSILNNAANLIE
jgi:signal transduction histidine kinase